MSAGPPAARQGDERARFVVLGVGNPILSDDGAGILALEAVGRARRLPAGVRLVDAGTAGPGVLGAVAGCDGLLVLDAVDVGGPPGEVVRLDLADGTGWAAPRNAHELGLETLLQDLRLLGEFPRRAVLLGVQPATVAIGTGLSPPVAEALDRLVDAALDELSQWAGRSAKRAATTGNGDDRAATEDER